MLLFRSEEHVERWSRQRGLPRGGMLSPERLWGLAEIWYRDRMRPEWRRRTAEEAEGIFASLGLAGDFWRLT